MAYDSNNNTPDNLNQSRIDLIEAVVHLESISSNKAYDKGPVFNHSLMQQVSRGPYRPSSTLPKGGYDPGLVEIVETFVERTGPKIPADSPGLSKIRRPKEDTGSLMDQEIDHNLQHDLFENNNNNS